MALLRSPTSPRGLATGILLTAVVGVLAAVLVANGNPKNMGVCGACFLRDAAGSLGLVGAGPKAVRPELVGIVLGAFALALARRRFVARSGSHAASRLLFGFWMGVGALVFLGCPFRMLQRIGGGDANALLGLAGFVPGVLLGLFFEKRGYSGGKTAPAPASVGLQAPIAFVLLLVIALSGGLLGPRPTDGGPPARAPFALALAIGLTAGALLSATGFCAVSAARQVASRGKGMLLAAVALIAAYAITSLVTGSFDWGTEGQGPAAHTNALWNAVPMALVGLAGALGGGCPVRQLVMAGEGNGDAFVSVVGIALGAAVAHGLGAVSTAKGVTVAGQTMVIVGLVWCVVCGAATTFYSRRGAAPVDAAVAT